MSGAIYGDLRIAGGSQGRGGEGWCGILLAEPAMASVFGREDAPG
jgi:hypothetical protein